MTAPGHTWPVSHGFETGHRSLVWPSGYLSDRSRFTWTQSCGHPYWKEERVPELKRSDGAPQRYLLSDRTAVPGQLVDDLLDAFFFWLAVRCMDNLWWRLQRCSQKEQLQRHRRCHRLPKKILYFFVLSPDHHLKTAKQSKRKELATTDRLETESFTGLNSLSNSLSSNNSKISLSTSSKAVSGKSLKSWSGTPASCCDEGQSREVRVIGLKVEIGCWWKRLTWSQSRSSRLSPLGFQQVDPEGSRGEDERLGSTL